MIGPASEYWLALTAALGRVWLDGELSTASCPRLRFLANGQRRYYGDGSCKTRTSPADAALSSNASGRLGLKMSVTDERIL
jgi:hypothetical protein